MNMHCPPNSPYPLLFTSIALILLLLHLLSPFPNSHHHNKQPQQQQHHHPVSPQGKFSFQEKTRLGSTPPSCHNKCNGCHPCMAVQVPSVPSHKRAVHDNRGPTSSTSSWSRGEVRKKKMPASMEFIDPSPAAGRYSNYKPLGWKCRCGNHFYNP